ncbi:mediator of RNA polymerase II transcription subunit 8 [Collariella sp. IMI 366227]|nr:mediator of RNA polymerase II transcription subunit 8 [Collariella sp. IMI 366227]
MASLNLTPEELKQLELLRNRLSQLTSSLASLRGRVINSNPLPTSDSLQASAAILQQNIRSLQELSTENADLFQRVAVHPSTNFPGRSQEHVLLQLLRKKLEPDVENWVEEARNTARASGIDPSKLAAGMRVRGEHDYDDEDTYGMDQEDVPSDPFNEQWADMRDAFQETLKQYVSVQVTKKYTVEEQAMGVENVRTGLKQNLEESDEEDEDEDEDEEEADDDDVAMQGGPVGTGAGAAAGGKTLLEPEHAFWLAAQGSLNLPRNIELESQPKGSGMPKRPGPPR